MRKKPMDIDDDEIRVISPSGERKSGNGRKNRKVVLFIIAAVFAFAVVCVGIYCIFAKKEGDGSRAVSGNAAYASDMAEASAPEQSGKGYVEVIDSVVDGRGLRFLFPCNAVPVLAVGSEIPADTTAVLMAPAADVRADNGKIAGSFVLAGDLISKGEAKAGYCSIVDGRISIGVADATPMLEEAIESNGYFFRQYPLVVGGQIVENKPKGTSLRKALVEVDGRIGIALSEEKLSFHDFSQALVNAGVRNAIYLVGSTSPGYYRDEFGRLVRFGNEEERNVDQANFIVWK